MVRGGSWNNNLDNVRSSVRNNNHPDNRSHNIDSGCLCLNSIESRFSTDLNVDAMHILMFIQPSILNRFRNMLIINLFGIS